MKPPTREQELLILATRVALPPAQEARAAALLEEGPDWALLLEQAGRFGMLPLLHHHFGRPALAGRVPEGAREALAKGYLRTSMKNLRILELLRRILEAARDAGVPVLLLKGAFLARGVYGDPGLRPMGDLDLLCRKEDGPAFEALLTRMGAFKAETPAGPSPERTPVRRRVAEKIGHDLPWWFKEVCRVEVHYHLLARNSADDARLQEELWAQALVHDWDGLAVRSLGPAHQVLHLASHFLHHALEGPFFLYWLTDVREAFRLYRGSLEGRALAAQARALGLERDCRQVCGLLGEPWGDQAAVPEAQASARLAALMGRAGSLVPTAGRYLEVLRGIRHAGGARDKVRYLRDVFLPPASRMERRYGTRNRFVLPFLYVADPFVRVFEVIRGRFRA